MALHTILLHIVITYHLKLALCYNTTNRRPSIDSHYTNSRSPMIISKKIGSVVGIAVLILGMVGSASAQEETHDSLLNFEALSDSDAAEVQQAHEALEAANAEMCALMVRLYADHVGRVHGGTLDDESASFLERECRFRSMSDHIALSLETHEEVHEHSSGHDDE